MRGFTRGFVRGKTGIAEKKRMGEQIALGMGNNVDYEMVWDSRVVEQLIVELGVCARDLEQEQPITSERALLISILRFLRAGKGGERFVDDSSAIESFAQRFGYKVTIGGTSPRAAIAMRKLGYTSALHLVQLNDHVRRLIPHDSPYVCSSAHDSLFPHLIVQFAADSHVHAGDIHICAQRPNRIIYHADTDNIRMELNEHFGEIMAGARVFLISGFNAMHDAALLEQRLQTLGRIMARLPAAAQVFFEDAAFFNPAFNARLRAVLGSRINIYSLNEDELQAHLGRTLNLLDAVAVRDALAELPALIPAPVLVVHTMHWALAYGANAQAMAAALKGGVTMATTRYVYGDDFAAEDYAQTAKLAPNPQGAAFTAELARLLPADACCCVPVALVQTAQPTTVGLGDAFVGGFLPPLLG